MWWERKRGTHAKLEKDVLWFDVGVYDADGAQGCDGLDEVAKQPPQRVWVGVEGLKERSLADVVHA